MLEKSLTVLNDELLVLPGGLSRILGIITHLNISTTISANLLYAGIGLVETGLLIRHISRQKSE